MLKRAALGALPLLIASLAGCGSSGHPAASVNGHDISVSDYHAQLNYKRQIQTYNGGVDYCFHNVQPILCKQMKYSALTDLIDDELVREYASKHHVTVSDADFRREWTQIYRGRFQSNPMMLNAFAKRMGISVDDLKARVRQDMLRQAVLDSVTSGSPTSGPAIRVAGIYVSKRDQSAAVQRLLRLGVPFLKVAGDLARQKGSPCSSPGSCGDFGWTPDALLAPYRRFLLRQQTGTPVGPIRLQQGYEYFLVESRSNHRTFTAGERQQLRALAFSQWLASQEKHATVKRYAA